MGSKDKPTLVSVSPQLPSSDLDRTIEFMTESLGFELLSRYPDLALFQRDGVRIHYWSGADAETMAILGQNSSCYFSVNHIKGLFEEFKASGVPFGYELTTQPWGMHEMQVNDPDGNALRFGQPC